VTVQVHWALACGAPIGEAGAKRRAILAKP
jgi:hypothetical protein